MCQHLEENKNVNLNEPLFSQKFIAFLFKFFYLATFQTVRNLKTLAELKSLNKQYTYNNILYYIHFYIIPSIYQIIKQNLIEFIYIKK